MNKFSKIIAATAVSGVVAAVSFAPALAESPGQLQSGSGTYVVKNVTQNGSYATSTSAKPCEQVKFSVRLHNTEFGELKNIVVKANLGSGTSVVSTMTATPDSSAVAGTTGSATVNLSSAQALTADSGSVQVYDGSSNLIKSVTGDITKGVNVGSLNGSTTEFVNFTAKVDCPTTPTTPVTPAAVTPEQPAALPETGAEGAGLAGIAGSGALGYAVVQYRRSRKAVADKLLNR
jgi:hypothetical protein